MWISLSVLRETKIIWGRDVISDGIGKLLIFALIMYSVTDELQQCVNDKKWHQNYVGNLLYIDSYVCASYVIFASCFVIHLFAFVGNWGVKHLHCFNVTWNNSENSNKVFETYSLGIYETNISF